MHSLKQPHLRLCIAANEEGITQFFEVRGIFRRRELANAFMAEHPGTAMIDHDNDCRIFVCDVEPMEIKR